MKDTIRFSLTLFIICFVASGLLAIANAITTPEILAQRALKEERDLKVVLLEAEKLKPFIVAEEVAYYKALDREGKILGYIAKAKAKGYASMIETFFSINEKGKILNIKVSSQNETPGLGAKIVEDIFRDKFKDKKLEELDVMEGITGATISSKAVIASIKNKAEEVLQLIKK